MTDKELLELSAKAAGYNIWWKTGACKAGEYESAFIGEVPWNPLTDDGDALRLAVKLVEFEPYKSRGYLPIITSDIAVTRRAITRAAAEIGKGMK